MSIFGITSSKTFQGTVVIPRVSASSGSMVLLPAIGCFHDMVMPGYLIMKRDNRIGKGAVLHHAWRLVVRAISSRRREPSPTRTLAPSGPGADRVQITCKTSSAYHVQHAMCHVERRDSSAITCDRAEIAFLVALSGQFIG